MKDQELGTLLAESLWKHFEFELPDTPNRITQCILKTLEKNDLKVVEKKDLEPIRRCKGCGAQVHKADLCAFCANWHGVMRGKK